MNPIKTGIIGAGARAISFCQFIQKNPEKINLVALADEIIGKAEFLDNEYNLGAKIYDNFEALIDDNEIEAVIISTPDHLHVAPVIAALKANKHVYLEKPLATTLPDCDTMIEATKSSEAICYLGFNMRHSPMHEKIYDLIKEGCLGKITTIEANEWYYEGKTYFRRWNRLRKFGGGLWLTKACHDFDLITWIAGGKPQRIYATSNLSHYKPIQGAGPRCRDCAIKNECPDFYDINKSQEINWMEAWRQLQLMMDQNVPIAPDICLFNSDKDTFDNGIAVIDYDNDIRATYTVNVLASRTTRQMSIIGTEGMAEADMEKGLVIYTQRHTGKVIRYDMTKETKGSHGGADERIFTDFFDICRNGGTPRSNLLDGRLAVQISVAARESSDTGTAILLT